MPCVKGTPNCTVTNSSDRYGVLSGYASTAGYDLATGLGSVNAANLVNNWSNANFVASSTTLTLSPSTITHGSQVSATVKVTSTSGTPTGNVSINALAANGSVQNGTLQNGSYTASLGNFPGGAYSVQAHYAGDGTYAPSDSNPVTLTVSPESSTTTLAVAALQPLHRHHHDSQQRRHLSLRRLFLLRADVAGVSGQGSATGNITLTDSGAPLDGGTFRLNSTSNTEDQTRALAPGTHVITAAYSGDASFNPSTSSPVTHQHHQSARPPAPFRSARPVLSARLEPSPSPPRSAPAATAPANQQGYGAAAPSGIVTFTSGSPRPRRRVPSRRSTYPATVADAGSVTFTLPASLLPIGNNAITVSYSGDTNYSALHLARRHRHRHRLHPGRQHHHAQSVVGHRSSPGASYTFTAAVPRSSRQPAAHRHRHLLQRRPARRQPP